MISIKPDKPKLKSASNKFSQAPNKAKAKIANSHKRIRGSQTCLGEENGVPRVLLVLEEENPEAIIGGKRIPRLAHQAQLHSLLGPQESQYLHQYIRGYMIERPQ
jgi:hypothetical protein